jgi:hypothetical protein
LLIVKKPDVIQKNELYFCNQGSNVIQNQLSKSKHRLKSFVLQACVITGRDIFIFDGGNKKLRNVTNLYIVLYCECQISQRRS